MTTYWLSFRIYNGSAGGKTYADRRKGLIDAMEKESSKKHKLWDDTTSFVVFEARSNDCAAIARRLSATLNRGHDVLVIRKMEARSAAVFGTGRYNDLESFMTDGDGISYLVDITPSVV